MSAKPKAASVPRHAARCYSYIRFSTPAQAEGSSLARQLRYASDYAKKHGLVLDESLRMFDAGKSAFHGRHVKQGGALHEFLKRIEAGMVEPGSVLVLESWDRFSRQTPMAAFRLLSEIIEAGISVVTATNGKRWDKESMTKDEWSLLEVIVDMSRAHKESSRKSELIKGAIREKCEGWLKGEYKGKVGGVQTDPNWVKWDDDAQRFVLDEERAEPMRRMIHYYMAGYGSIRITEALAEEGLAISEKYPTSRVRQIITSPALKGVKTINVDGATFSLEGYYPALLSADRYDELQLVVSKRSFRQGLKGEVPGIITGQKITYCGYCGTLMAGQNIKASAPRAKPRADGLPNQRRLRCYRYYFFGERCPGGDSCMVAPIEHAILEYCSDQFNLSALLEGNDEPDPLMKSLAAARKRVAATEAKLAKITRALLADEGDAPQTFVKLTRELESEKRGHEQEVQRLEREVGVQTRVRPSTAKEWKRIKSSALALHFAGRMTARRLFSEAFERVEIFMHNFNGALVGYKGDTSGMIALHLLSKRGVSRLLLIDRLSGALVQGFDVNRAKLEKLRVPLAEHAAKQRAAA
ncbi:recombinase family protein [Paraburkholderia sp. EG287B]|uniref:recombinase family protein n=1 Tax=Paraburkholderia sp. EG287B TaxID=3237010 RepID=UPI0034D2BB53